MTIRVRSESAADTRAIAGALASLLEAGDVVVLAGDLGGGKTTFVQGAAAALGTTDRVTSPTFAIVQEYDGAIPIAHVDVYRLTHVQELHDLGFDEVLDSGRVVFVEWGDRAAQVLPRDVLVVSFSTPAGADDERDIEVAGRGLSWARRADAVAQALHPWSVPR